MNNACLVCGIYTIIMSIYGKQSSPRQSFSTQHNMLELLFRLYIYFVAINIAANQWENTSTNQKKTYKIKLESKSKK